MYHIIFLLFLFIKDQNCQAPDVPVSESYFSPKSNAIPFNISETIRLLGKISEEPAIHSPNCRKNATCVSIPSALHSCYGLRLPYSSTSLGMTSDAQSFDEVQEKLNQWATLRAVPKCWAVIQPLLCAVYLPKCEDGVIELPSQEMCKVTRGPCRIVNMDRGWPDYVQCANIDRFPVGCRNEFQNMKTLPGKCKAPLIEVENTISMLDGVDGCGLPCEPPHYSTEELDYIRALTFFGILPSLLANFFVMATYFLDWKNAKRFPSVMVFYLNLCFFTANMVWLWSFYPGMRDAITCWKDGTARKAEPVSNETFHCTFSFILFYSPSMTAFVCLAALAYAWYQLSLHQAKGSLRERIEGRDAYFYLTAFSFTLVMTIIALSTLQVDADRLSGLCFISGSSTTRTVLLIIPMMVTLIIVETFHLLGFINFRHIYSHSSGSESRKLTWFISRTATQAVFYFLIGVAAFSLQLYELLMESHWRRALREYIICRTIHEDENICPFPDRLSPSLIVFRHWLFFATTILASSCAWTTASLNIWRQFYNRKFKKIEPDPVNHTKKHRVIAEAYKQRLHLQETGRLSIAIPSDHPDPAGLALELNNSNSNVSSAWAAALPHLVRRRNAVVGAGALGLRRSSMDSEISNCSFKRSSFLNLNLSRKQSMESLRSVFQGKFLSKRRSKLQRKASITSKDSVGSLITSSVKMKASSATRMTVSSSDNVTSCGERKTTKKKPSKGSSESVAPKIIRAKRTVSSRRKRRSRRKPRHDVAIQVEPFCVTASTQTSPQTVQKSVQTTANPKTELLELRPSDWTTTDESDEDSISTPSANRISNRSECFRCPPGDCQCGVLTALLGSQPVSSAKPNPFRAKRNAICHIELETLHYNSDSNSLESSITNRGSCLKMSS